jgi:hypothetical protein
LRKRKMFLQKRLEGRGFAWPPVKGSRTGIMAARRSRCGIGKRPVIYVHTPPFTDLTGFCDAVLRSLKAPHRPARLSAKWDQLLQLLGAVGTRMLILDEVNNLLIGKVDQRAMVMNGLKSLSNERSIPVVAMGTQDAVRVFQTDQQLGNRFEPMGLPR